MDGETDDDALCFVFRSRVDGWTCADGCSPDGAARDARPRARPRRSQEAHL
jgi:hypothetical protein